MKKASISVYLSICFSILIILFFNIIESCHLNVLISRCESISYFSLDSLFAQYSLPLFEEYGLFSINEQGMDLESQLEHFAKKNCSVSALSSFNCSNLINPSVVSADITNKTYITDSDGTIFMSQISDYIKYMEMDKLAENLLAGSDQAPDSVFKDNTDVASDVDFDNIDFDNIDSDNSYSGNGVLGNAGSDNADAVAKYGNSDFTDTIKEKVSHILKNCLLSMIVDNPESVSTLSVDKSLLPSVTCSLSTQGIENTYGYYKDKSEATKNKAYLCQYDHYKFPCYTSKCSNKYLLYQLEYIISGKDSDDENLLDTCMALISLRTAFNASHILKSSEKMSLIGEISSSITPVPIVRSVVKTTILVIWATAESIIDVKDLLSGKKVPLIKDDSQWSLSLDNLYNFSKNSCSVNDGKHGLSYSEYLKMLMIKENTISLCFRTMDIIQMNICKDYNEDFRISQCITSINSTIIYSVPKLFIPFNGQYITRQTYNYQ